MSETTAVFLLFCLRFSLLFLPEKRRKNKYFFKSFVGLKVYLLGCFPSFMYMLRNAMTNFTISENQQFLPFGKKYVHKNRIYSKIYRTVNFAIWNQSFQHLSIILQWESMINNKLYRTAACFYKLKPVYCLIAW